MAERSVGPVDVELVRERLRQVSYPGPGGDIVSCGFVRGIEIGASGCLTVRFAPDTDCGEKVIAMVEAIRAGLRNLPGVTAVHVERISPFPSTPATRASLELAAPEDLGGPALDGPRAVGVAVFQWEIDPNDPKRDNGDCDLSMDGWDYRVWWQVHPLGLIYGSIQAVRDETREVTGEQGHPLGRNVVVNLVYDLERDGIAAIYGSAGDFRPFVEAFRRAYGL